GASSLPEWEEFAGLDAGEIRHLHAALQSDRKYRESIPDWLDERGAAELGERWDASLKALNETAQVVLRTNRLKTDTDSLMELLAKEKIGTQKIAANALLVTERKNLFATQAFRAGHFEVQDYSSQQVAPFLKIQP